MSIGALSFRIYKRNVVMKAAKNELGREACHVVPACYVHVGGCHVHLARKCAKKIWRGTYCMAGGHNCGFWLANKLVQTNTAAPLPQGAFKTQLYFSKPKQAKSQAKNGTAPN